MMFATVLFALTIAPAGDLLPPATPTVVARPVSVAPPPRAVAEPVDCPVCHPDDLRCRARAALALVLAKRPVPETMPKVVPSNAEREAARKALKASKPAP